jgi:hypothetical protein
MCSASHQRRGGSAVPAWQYNNDAPIMTLFDTTSIRFYIQCHLFNSAITLPLLWLPPRRALNFATRRTSAELMHTHTPPNAHWHKKII